MLKATYYFKTLNDKKSISGDKIKSIKIEFIGTPLEDAVAILSLASPYPVELEVIEGGRISGEGWVVHHPLMKRAGSTGDVSTVSSCYSGC